MHCIYHLRIVMSWGWFVGCRNLLGYNTLCVCWIGMYGLFGVLLCCVGLCEGLLCVGGCKWRVRVVTCQFHGLGEMRNWGWDMSVAIGCSSGGCPCIRRIRILSFVQSVHLRLFKSGLRVFGRFARWTPICQHV